MAAAAYTEPTLSILVLDYLKEWESRLCLESIKQHIKVPYTVIYLHNGGDADYPYTFFKEGLVDQLIQTRSNTGLGIGTRNLFAASFGEYSLYLQNDQLLIRDLTQEDLDLMGRALRSRSEGDAPKVFSISLAGAPCGDGVYSERAHIVLTDMYKSWEAAGLLGYHGAGPYHDGLWREAQIQQLYRDWDGIHMIWSTLFVADNGRRAVRGNPDQSIWQHEPDTKRLWLVRGPVKEKHIYPKLSDAEWEEVLATQSWPAGLIPEQERKDSFVVPLWH